jgi:hypothetical protein
VAKTGGTACHRFAKIACRILPQSVATLRASNGFVMVPSTPSTRHKTQRKHFGWHVLDWTIGATLIALLLLGAAFPYM